MSNFEFPRGPEKDPVRDEAQEFCELVQCAIELAIELGRNPTEELKVKLKDINALVGGKSAHGGHSTRFRLRVTPAEGVAHHLSKNIKPLQDNPGPTVVDEVRIITEDQVEFFIQTNANWFIVFGHEMQIEPVILEPKKNLIV